MFTINTYGMIYGELDMNNITEKSDILKIENNNESLINIE